MSQIRAEETRKKILHSAMICFSRSGYDAASVADICDLAGVTKGAFYHHFASKQSLFLELLNEWMAELDGILSATQFNADTVLDALRQMAEKTKLVLNESQDRLPMFLEFWNQALRDQVVWKVTVAPFRQFIQLFSRLIQKGIDEGSIRPVDPEVISSAIVSMSLGFVLQSMMDPQLQDWEHHMHAGLMMLFDSIET